jgi:predicted nucleic acid-binding protein
MTTKILVDSSIASLAFRRRPEVLSPKETAQLRLLFELMDRSRATIIGAIRQELLTGIRTRARYDELRERLAVLPSLAVDDATHERAAIIANRCLDAGVITGHVDALVVAVAIDHSLPIWTVDNDFPRYAKAIPELQLFDDGISSG